MAERIITRTLLGGLLSTLGTLNLKHNIQDYTTLNQAISLKQIVDPLPEPIVKGMEVLPEYNFQTDSQNLYTQCFVIGNFGHKQINGASTAVGASDLTSNSTTYAPTISIPYTVPVPHLATDTGLYNIIPFVIRPVTDDLTTAHRKRYALRRTIEINSVLYAAYFGRVLDVTQIVPTTSVTEVVDGNETSFEFIPTFNNLRPTHPTEDTSYSASYGNVSAPISILFDEDDIQDLKDACRLLYNNENYAIISEVGLCSAVRKPITQKYPNSGVGTPIAVAANTFYEMVACQITMHITTYVSFVGGDQEYTMGFDLGASEPLFGVKAASK